MFFPRTARPQYIATGVKFDGSNDYMAKAADLSGNADGKLGILSFWIRLNGGDGVVQRILHSTNGNVGFQRTAANKYAMSLFNSDNTTAAFYEDSGTGTYTADGVWHKHLIAWNAGTAYFSWYRDGVALTPGILAASNNVTIDYTQTAWAIGASVAGADKLNADIAEFYFNTAETLDITVQANREKFRDASGRAVYLGADGSRPTGNAPIAYFKILPGAAASTFATNLGTGGNFTITGALDISTVSPPN